MMHFFTCLMLICFLIGSFASQIQWKPAYSTKVRRSSSTSTSVPAPTQATEYSTQETGSFDSFCGLPIVKESPITVANEEQEIRTIACLVDEINNVYKNIPATNWEARKAQITNILDRTKLSSCELCKYSKFDTGYPYTRNLIATDQHNYALLALCWNPGRESKIHNHPCDGCFVKVVRGAVKETRYAISPQTDEIVMTAEVVASAGVCTYMDDFVGLHKIGNPSANVPAVSLHLYTPPYSTCKLWNSEKDKLSGHTEGKSCFYSEYGVRTGATCLEPDFNSFI